MSDEEAPQKDQHQEDFARERDLQEETAHEPLGGCDVEHCHRMRD
jgi:hypothetical protein